MRKILDAAVGAIFKHKFKPARSTEAQNRRQPEAESKTIAQLHKEALLRVPKHGVKLCFFGFPFVPGLQRCKDRRHVRIVRGGHEIQPAESGYVLDSGSRGENLFDLRGGAFVAMNGRPIRQAERGEENTLIFVR